MVALRFLLPALLALAWGCGNSQSGLDAIHLKEVTLPGGQIVRAELMTSRQDLANGMMHRPGLPEGRGLLFVFAKPAKNRFWMLNVREPLDIVFLDRAHAIVEVAANAQPCPALPCRSYGGDVDSQFILELPGGSAAKYELKTGQTIRF